VTQLDAGIIRKVAERTMAWRQGTWYWGDAIATDGLLAADALVAGPWTSAIVDRIDQWGRDALISWEDALAPGRAIFELVAKGTLPPSVGERVLAAIQRLPRNPQGVPLMRPHIPEWRDVVWVDSLYHLPAAVAAAAIWKDDASLRSDALAIAEATVSLLSVPDGLAHFYDGGLGRNNGVVWSRGLGWALLGLLDLRSLIDEPASPQIDQTIVQLLTRFAATQQPDGHWLTVLGDPNAITETSAAAFFVAAALHPAARRFTSVPNASVDRAAHAVLEAIDADGTYRGVSFDTHARWEVAAYEHPPTRPSPWGQGAALRALSALHARPHRDGA
jgi:rhamnogalacturonyl hydrolase YesR